MPTVNGTVSATGGVSAYWLFTYNGSGHVVDLSNKQAILATGSYELFWTFRGQANAKITVTVAADAKVVFGPYDDNIPPGSTQGHGETTINIP
jgi:hypothetical protein